MKRLLLADDDPVILKKTAHFLSVTGWDVVTASSGRQALELLDKSFDALVLDRMMPEPNGDATLLEVRRKSEFDHICVLLLTGFGEVNSAVKAMRSGAYQYLQKPFDLEDLDRLLCSGVAWQRAHAIRRQLLGSFDTDKLLGCITGLLIDTVQPQGLYVIFLGADGSVSQIRRGDEVIAPDDPCLAPPVGERHFVKEILDKKQPVLSGDPSSVKKLNPILSGAQSLLAVPVFGGEEKLIGMIDLESLSEGAFDGRWKEVLQYLADIEGLSLEIAEKALVKADLNAERKANAKLQVLVKELAHHIMSPVQAIKFQADLAKTELPSSDVERASATLVRRFEDIGASVQEIERIVQYLRDVSGDIVLTLSQFDLGLLVAECAEEIRNEARKSRIAIKSPVSSFKHAVIADRGLLRYSLRCLLRNSIESIQRGQKEGVEKERQDEIEIFIDPNSRAELVTVGVRDTGPGVAERDLPKLFTPLFTTKTRQSLEGEVGLSAPGGLGLYSVARVMDLHGGTAEYAGHNTGRAIFLLRLPNAVETKRASHSVAAV